MYKKIFILFLALFHLNVFALTEAPIDITNMDITAISDALDKKIITSENLIKIYLERIEKYNDKYNALITVNDNAISEAQKLDEERANGNVRSILHGIPIIVKDNIDALNMPTTDGSKNLSDNYPIKDAEAIKKLKDAGAIIIAKSNMSKYAFYASSSTSDFGTVKNAYNIKYSSYGSSGGSAVSVALNFAVAALGTDTNSSVRLPASANSLVGYRPTLGLISTDGVVPYDPERDTIGTITKNVKDALILTNIMTDKNKINEEEYDLTNLKIGVPKSFIEGDDSNTLLENKLINEEVKKLILSAIEKIEKAGAKIIYIDDYYTISKDNEVAKSYSGYLFCDSFNKYIINHTGTIKTFSELAEKDKSLENYNSECNTTKTLDEKNNIKYSYSQYIGNLYNENDIDIIMYPSSKNKLLKIGTSGLINLSAHASSTINYPAITIPMGYDNDNLPYGLEIMTKTGKDTKLLSIAASLEKLNMTENKSAEPSLYEVNAETTKLINRYKNRYNKDNMFLMRKWMNKSKAFLENYNDIKNKSQEAKEINNLYTIYLILTFILKIIFSILTLIFLLIILLLVRKSKIKTKKRRKSSKSI